MRKRNAALASAALLTLPLLSVLPSSPVSATDVGTVTQMTNGDHKSTVPMLTGSAGNLSFHSSAGNFPGATQSTSGTDNAYSINLSTGAYTRYTVGASALGVDISDNGSWVVYTKGDDVYRNNVAGTAEQLVASGNAASGWFNNAGGARIDNSGRVVFQSLASNLLLGPAGDTDDGQWDIFYWNGTSTIRLSNADNLSFLNPDISANGAVVAFNSATVAGSDISGLDVFIGGPTNGGATNSTVASNNQSDLPRVNTDGSKVVFRSNSTDLVPGSPNTSNAYVWTAAGFARVTGYDDGIGVTNPAISGDGGHIAFQRGSQIYRSVAASGGATIQLSAHTGSGVLINYPTLNTDGSKVAWAQSLDDTIPGVEVMMWTPNSSPPLPPGCKISKPDSTYAPLVGSATNARVWRLYQAYFLRQPEADGFAYWQTRVAQGTDYNWISSFFADSTEFKATYGNLTNSQFVDLLYPNILCRQKDAGGHAFWLAQLDSGAKSRGRLMLEFSNSTEYLGNTATIFPL